MPSGSVTRPPVALVPVPVLTVALAAACWLASVWQMRGMDAQKLLASRPFLDATLALTIIAFGVLVVVVPSTFSV
jgi:uncharacterized membrane protein YidH (DUF202 family)